MTQFRLTVTGITRAEYLDACRVSGRRMYAYLAMLMVLICGIIILISKNTSFKAFLGPVVVYALFVAGFEILARANYKDQLAVIDPPVEYEFSASGWTIRKGSAPVEILWKGTPRMKKTKHCIFLYNDDMSSNLLPLRLLTQGQINSLENWYQISRASQKEYQKQQDLLARKEFREGYSKRRANRTGPVWGPLSKRWRK